MIINGPKWETSTVALQCPDDDPACQIETSNLNSNLSLTLSPKAEAGKDAFIQKRFSNINFGNEPDLSIGHNNIGGQTDSMKILVDFDLSLLAEGTVVHDANLVLVPKTIAFEDTIFLARIIEPWNETSVTWEKQPAYDSSIIYPVAVSIRPDTLHSPQFISVTRLLQQMLDDAENSHGFMILPGKNSQRHTYGSSDEKDWSFHPRLELEVRAGNAPPIRDTIVVRDTIEVEQIVPVFDTIEVEQIIQVFDTITQVETISVTDTLLIDFDIINNTNQLSRVQIKVYPNPTSNLLLLEIPATGGILDPYQVTITDLQGRLIFERRLNDSLLSMNLADFGSPGLYFLVIRDRMGQLVSQKKIVLQD